MGAIPTRRVLTEAAAYAGLSFALVGVFALVDRADPAPGVSLAVALALTAGLLAAGALVGEDDAAAHQRLRSVLWFGALFAWSIAVSELLNEVLDLDATRASPRLLALLNSALVLAAAVVLWLRLRRTLQHLAMFGSLSGLVSTLVFFPEGPFVTPDPTGLAVVNWVLGAAWIGLAWRGAVEPRGTGFVLGALWLAFSPLLLLIPPASFSDGVRATTELWTLASGALVLAAGSVVASRGVEGIGIVAMLVGAAALSADQIASRDLGGSAAALAIGLALLGGGVGAIRAGRRSAPTTPGSLPEPPD
jgi:hypothetical protein